MQLKRRGAIKVRIRFPNGDVHAVEYIVGEIIVVDALGILRIEPVDKKLLQRDAVEALVARARPVKK